MSFNFSAPVYLNVMIINAFLESLVTNLLALNVHTMTPIQTMMATGDYLIISSLLNARIEQTSCIANGDRSCSFAVDI